MSTKGIYTALSGAIAQNLRLETTANNLANVNTTGFKKDSQTFQEYLTANEKPPAVIQVPKVPASIESFYDMQGGDKSYVDSAGTFTNFSQGSLKATGGTLDVAIDGRGFFEVATPRGVRLTRNGSFMVDGNGQLVTRDGWPLLRSAGAGIDPAERTVKIEPGAVLTITDSGEIFQGEQSLGKISVVDVADTQALQKEGSSTFTFKPNFPAQFSNMERPNLRQGFVEGSNVNVVQEMTDMITATRLFESTQKAIQAYDSMADKLVNQVPKAQ